MLNDIKKKVMNMNIDMHILPFDINKDIYMIIFVKHNQFSDDFIHSFVSNKIDTNGYNVVNGYTYEQSFIELFKKKYITINKMQSHNIKNNIYLGSRGDDFKNMIVRLLRRAKLKPKYIDILTNEKSMKEYAKAFTSTTADKVNNYERFEQIGDVTANKFIVWYVYKRFPQLDCTLGVKVVARLRINYGAKASFARIGEQLGFWEFISAGVDGDERNKYYRNNNKKDLLEDCLESFIGCTEYLLDNTFRPGVGYGVVYDLLSSIFNDIDMSLKYEDLYDAKTRLKETFDMHKSLGTWKFIDKRENVEGSVHTIGHSVLYRVPNSSVKKTIDTKINNEIINKPQSDWEQIGEGYASKKTDAQQKAADHALQYLHTKGFFKKTPPEYSLFCNS
jgi:dsRNA-specific ribonuclease